MKTTTPHIETIISGFQTLVWVTLFLVTFLGTTERLQAAFCVLDNIGKNGWSSVVLTLLLGAAYTLGLASDGVWSFFRFRAHRFILPVLSKLRSRWSGFLSHSELPSNPYTEQECLAIRLKLMTVMPELAEELDSIRRRELLLFSTLINITLAAVFGFNVLRNLLLHDFSTWSKYPYTVLWLYAILLSFVVLPTTLTAFLHYRSLSIGTLETAKQLLNAGETAPPSPTRPSPRKKRVSGRAQRA